MGEDCDCVAVAGPSIPTATTIENTSDAKQWNVNDVAMVEAIPAVWYVGKVEKVQYDPTSPDGCRLRIHFLGWGGRHDEWVSPAALRPVPQKLRDKMDKKLMSRREFVKGYQFNHDGELVDDTNIDTTDDEASDTAEVAFRMDYPALAPSQQMCASPCSRKRSRVSEADTKEHYTEILAKGGMTLQKLQIVIGADVARPDTIVAEMERARGGELSFEEMNRLKEDCKKRLSRIRELLVGETELEVADE